MSFYETLYIVDPNLENRTLEKTMDEIGKELEKTKSKIINHRIWGKKRLAYVIERQKYGSYIIMQFEGGDQGKIFDFDTWMKLNNSVLRHMTVLLDEKPELYLEEKKLNLENEEKEPGESEPDEKQSASEAVVTDLESEKKVEESENQDEKMEDEKSPEPKEVE